jgi:hypothetical protein
MAPLSVIVLHVVRHRGAEVAFSHEDHPVQAFGLDGKDESLGMSVEINRCRTLLDG